MNRNRFLKYMALTPLMGLSLKNLANMGSPLPEGKKMPVLFVGHGNPMNAILENEITRGWRAMVEGLQPNSILCISAHWETRGTRVTMSPHPETIHDFGGFPKELFEVKYPAPGNPQLGHEIIKNIKRTTVMEDHEWGLDHGTWTVILKMFDKANIPVVQLSLDRNLSMEEHYELARELEFLRTRGVLIVGSGNMIHNLYDANWDSDKPYDWALEFDQQVKELIVNRDHRQLIKADRISPEARLAIPTAEHYIPMLYTLAMQGKGESIRFFNEEIKMGSMGMRSFVIS